MNPTQSTPKLAQPNHAKIPLLSGCYGFARGGSGVVGPISLNTNSSQLIIITGANGKGKTTLLAGIASLLEWHPNVKIPAKLPDQKQIIWVGHTATILPGRRVGTLLSLDAALLGANTQTARKAADFFSLPWKTDCASLSQGWKKRLALARLRLAPHRNLWIIDEPFDLLDTEGVNLVTRALVEHLASPDNAAILALPDGEETASAKIRLKAANLNPTWHNLQ
ncbi:MAG: ATP-binding cassette domain-containing protein [Alphaproteobacteria bacterium]